MYKIYSKEHLAQQRAKIAFPRDFRLQDHVRELRDQSGGHVYEFIGTDSFGAEWNERRRFEVDAGRVEEPVLYTPIYEEIRDASLPQNIAISRIGPGGVVLEEIFEGGEVKFASVTSSEVTVRIRHYGVGIEYSKDLVVYNSLWRVPIIEREAGIAYNALLNHVHLSPFLTATYTAANQTGPNPGGDTLVEDMMLTIEDAIVASKTDTTNPRRGPYVLLISSAEMFLVEKALQRVAQQGIARQSSAIDMIRSVIAYDGWTGTRGAKTTTYEGVTAGKAYLISQQYRGLDHVSYVKQDFGMDGQDNDASRFMFQNIYDTYFGVFSDPLRSTEEIEWPTS
jgi:hypothetical protein